MWRKNGAVPVEQRTKLVEAAKHHGIRIEVKSLGGTAMIEQVLECPALHRCAELHHRMAEQPLAILSEAQIVEADQTIEGLPRQIEAVRGIVAEHQMNTDFRRQALDGTSQNPRLGQVIGGDAGERLYR